MGAEREVSARCEMGRACINQFRKTNTVLCSDGNAGGACARLLVQVFFFLAPVRHHGKMQQGVSANKHV